MNRIVLSISIVLLCRLTIAQVPQGFNYQAIARNGDTPITSTLPVRITIQSELSGGIIFWEEIHSTVTPNESGLFTLVVGAGVKQPASTVATFPEINWSVTPKYIKTEIDYGGWQDMGSAALWAVPYSMLAKNLEGPVEKLGVIGTTANPEEALFEVKNKDGQTIFAVYNEGVRINVADGDAPAKGAKGGFAIGGFDLTKGTTHDLFIVSQDSIRAYIYDNPSLKGPKGGFAIGGFSVGKGDIKNFLDLSPKNYFIGHNAGLKNTTGVFNSVIGYESAFNNTEGSDNIFIGYQSGYSNELGLNNIFIGKNAGYNNIGEIQTSPFYLAYGSYNVFIGNHAGFSNESGWTNLFLGISAGYGNTSGSDNTYIGNFSGESSNTGWGNSYLGAFSGRSNLIGVGNVYLGYDSGNKNVESSNVFVGSYSGSNNISGANNAFVGSHSGYNSTGGNNVFIGNWAGSEEAGSNKLYIANSNTSTPLIWGDFTNKRVVINGNAGINISNRTLFVNGSAGGTGGWYNDSDARLKKNIVSIPDALNKVLNLHGVEFEWIDTENHAEGKHIGFIAQQAVEVIPEAVDSSNNRFSMDYGSITSVLVEAMKEQQQQIKTQQKEIDELKALVNNLITNQTKQGKN